MSKFILKTVELAVSRGEEKLLRSFGDVILFDDEILNQGRRDAVVEIAFFKEGQIPSVLMLQKWASARIQRKTDESIDIERTGMILT